MTEQQPTGSPQPVANFQAYGNAGVMYEDGSSSLTKDQAHSQDAAPVEGRGPAQSFMKGLQDLERTRDIHPFTEHFAEECTLWRQTYAESQSGREGLHAFWGAYLKQFQSIATTFTHVTERDDLAILEWDSQGELQGGRPIHYRGVSILEFEGEKVKNFKTYFDSAHFIDSSHSNGLH